MKMAFISGGRGYNLRFFVNKNGKYKDYFDDIIYILDLDKHNLNDYDIVVFSSRLRRDFLEKHKTKFEEFLSLPNKAFVFFGGLDGVLENVFYQKCVVNFWWWVQPKGADLPLYIVDDRFKKYLCEDDCKWHYHGFFKDSKNTHKLLVNELDECIACKDEKTYKSKIYLTSLDPDYHFGQGFMPKTEYFFDKFMEYVKEDFKA